jgi:hypothetical protein
MNKNQAKKLAQYHQFTKIELFDILKDALNFYSDNYWKKPNKVNPIFDNGSYFNSCRNWIKYRIGENDNEIEIEPVVIRVLEGFGKFSKVQLSSKKKFKVEVKHSEKPQL